MLPHDQPPPPDHSTPNQLTELQMFAWRRCDRHAFLGVSVLVGRSFDPVCFLPDGTSHPVELKAAS